MRRMNRTDPHRWPVFSHLNSFITRHQAMLIFEFVITYQNIRIIFMFMLVFKFLFLFWIINNSSSSSKNLMLWIRLKEEKLVLWIFMMYHTNLVVFILLSSIYSSVFGSNKYSKEANIKFNEHFTDDPKIQIRDVDKPFRLAKLNLLWSKASLVCMLFHFI